MAESSSSPQLFSGCVNSEVEAIELGEYIINDDASILLLSKEPREAYYQVKNGVIFDVKSSPTKDSCEIAYNDESLQELYIKVGETKYYLDRYITDGDSYPTQTGPLNGAESSKICFKKTVHDDVLDEEHEIPYCKYYLLLVVRDLYKLLKSNPYTYEEFAKRAKMVIPEWIIKTEDEASGETEVQIISSEIPNPLERIDLHEIYETLVNKCAVNEAIDAANKFFNKMGLEAICVTFNVKPIETEEALIDEDGN